MPIRPRQLFRVYIDETGDRGSSARSSPFFVVTAVIVSDDEDDQVRRARAELCGTLRKPPSTVLHWSENLKRHDERQVASRWLATLPVRICYVVVDKASSAGKAGNDPVYMYNYALRRLLERISWYVDGRWGSSVVTMAHVRHFPYERLESYWDHLHHRAQTNIRWRALPMRPRTRSQTEVDGLQVADIAAGCLSSAINVNRFGNVEPQHLLDIAHLVYSRPPGDIRSYGLNVVGEKRCVEAHDWWPTFVHRSTGA